MTRFTAVAALALATLGATPALADFSGRWNVTIFTAKGPCDQSYLVPVEVDGSRIIYRGTVGLSGGGSITANGAIRTNFSRGGDSISASGRLSGNSGSGSWTAPERKCSGTWTASRG
jgi:hypothetical protein